MKTIVLKFILWTAVILWMVLIFCLSAQTASQSSSLSGQTIRKIVEVILPKSHNLSQVKKDKLIFDLQYITRKTAHVLAYMVLGVLCMTALLQLSLRMEMRFSIAFIICTGYAASDEFHQLFISGRGPQIRDIFIDFCGALLGILLVMLIYWIWNRKGLKSL